MMIKILPVLMCGGSGTRLWPLSTEAEPKQFHALATERTMLQDTALRVKGLDSAQAQVLAPVAICGLRHAGIVEAQLTDAGSPPQSIVLEPVARNTAAVASLAALIGREIDPNAIVLLLPADHVVRDESAFAAAAIAAARSAHERIVTLGIKPQRPETGYGYIEAGGDLAHGSREIARFVEKPDRATAEAYVSGDRHSWNAGIFLFRPDVLLGEMERYAPEILEAARQALDHAARQRPFVALDLERFGRCPSASIDVAVMEKTTLGAIVECDMGWADVGSWSELWRIGPLDADGNRLHGNVILMEATGTLALSEGPLVAALGVQDLVIVASKDAVLVTTRDRAQDVRHLAAKAMRETSRA